MATAAKRFQLMTKSKSTYHLSSGRAHRLRRGECLLRAGYVCQCKGCGKCSVTVERPCGAVATDADHIVPHRGNKQLLTDMANYQALCEPCHCAKTWRGE